MQLPGHSTVGTPQARPGTALDSFQEHRALLLSIAYRMVGSMADAEDIVQETFIRWQQVSRIESPRAFLVTIVSRLCINHWFLPPEALPALNRPRNKAFTRAERPAQASAN